MARVFISHATTDLAFARKLFDWLRDEGHEPFLAQDPQSGTLMGEDWEQRIYKELQRADAVVCIMTSAFMASLQCTVEVTRAKAIGRRLLPLHVEPNIERHPLMERLHYVDYTADPVHALGQFGRALQSLNIGGRLELATAPPAPSNLSLSAPGNINPFPGLKPFTAELSHVFFGRSRETRELAGQLRATTGGGLLAVVGPSGCGKSSLVHAGLLPLMDGDRGWLTAAPWLPGKDPLFALAQSLVTAAGQVGLSWSPPKIRDGLNRDGGLLELANDLLSQRSDTEERRLLITIDQAEELFTHTNLERRNQLGVLLRDALAGPVRVVTTLRSEFLDDLRDLPSLAEVPIQTYVLGNLTTGMLSQAIIGPAQAATLNVSPDLVKRLVDDTDSGEALPLLAFTLQQLADGLSERETLSAERYDDLGGVHGALSRRADDALNAAANRSHLTNQQILAGLVRLATLDGSRRRTRRRVYHAKLTGPQKEAVAVFVERGLLTVSNDESGQWISVAHEALLTAWPPLDSAIIEHTAALRAARSAEQAAADWANGDRAEHFLWDGKRLTTTLTALGIPGVIADQPLASPIVDLNPDTHDFLVATHDNVEAARRRNRRRRARVNSTVSVLVTLALVALVIALVQKNGREDQQQLAIARRLVDQADAVRDIDPRIALQLGVAAHDIYPSGETRASLVNTLTTTSYTGTITAENGGVSSVSFTPGGDVLAVGGSDGTVSLWDVNDPAHPNSLHKIPSPTGKAVTSTAFAAAPWSTILAVGGSDGNVTLWDVTEPDQPWQLAQPYPSHPDDAVTSVAFAPDGTTLAVGGSDGSVVLLDLTAPEHPQQLGPDRLTSHNSRVSSVAFAPPDGDTLATGSDDKTVILWDVSDLSRTPPIIRKLSDYTSGVYSVAFSPDGQTLATGGSEGTANVRDLRDPAQPSQHKESLVGHGDAVNSVAFVPNANGTMLATGSDDGTAILWDLTKAEPAQLKRFSGHGSGVFSIAFSPDGHILATGSSDGTASLWDLTDRPRPLKTFADHNSLVKRVEFEVDHLVTTSSSGAKKSWNVADPGHSPVELPSEETGVYPLAYSPDRKIDVTASPDNAVLLWDVSNMKNRPRPLGGPLTGHSSGVSSAVFAKRGQVLATGSDDGTAILWDVADPEHPRRLGQRLIGHANRVSSMAFADDANMLATGSDDGTAILWDTTDLNHPRRLGHPLAAHHPNAVNTVAFAPAGGMLATGSDDGKAILWDLTLLNDLRTNTLERACSITGSGLDEAEWARYIPELRYRNSCQAQAGQLR